MKSEELMKKHYSGISRIAGPLLYLRSASDLPYSALVEITAPDGQKCGGQVIEVSDTITVVQVFEQTMGLDVVNTRVSLVDREVRFGVSEALIGRLFNGSGKAIDGLAPIVADKSLAISGTPIHPVSRERPRDFLQTGISAVDGFNTLVRGQKLPIFSGSGLPAQASRARVLWWFSGPSA